MIGKDPRPGDEHARTVRGYAEYLVPALREVARSYGYALLVHGSLERDLDLLAVPWRDVKPCSAQSLVDGLYRVCDAVLGMDRQHGPTPKPWGRTAWSFHPAGERPYIDLSVMAFVDDDPSVLAQAVPRAKRHAKGRR